MQHLTKDLHNKGPPCCLERCQSLKQLSPMLIESHFSGPFMVTMSPGVILCIMITKFYAGESLGTVRVLACLSPTAGWNEANKESRTVGGKEPSLSSVLFFYSLRNLSSPSETIKKKKSANTAEPVFFFSRVGVICSMPTKHFVLIHRSQSHTKSWVPVGFLGIIFLQFLASSAGGKNGVCGVWRGTTHDWLCSPASNYQWKKKKAFSITIYRNQCHHRCKQHLVSHSVFWILFSPLWSAG